MKNLMKSNYLYVIAVIIALILTPYAIESTKGRGYTALGGECLLVPLAVTLIYNVKLIGRVIASWRH